MAKPQESVPARGRAAGRQFAYSGMRPAGARRGVGYWAFMLNRAAGLVLAVYLLFHLIFLSNLYRGREAYTAFLAVVSQPAMIYLDVALAAAAIFHGFNGLRLTAHGLGAGVRRQALWFWVIFVLGLGALMLMGGRMLAGGQ